MTDPNTPGETPAGGPPPSQNPYGQPAGQDPYGQQPPPPPPAYGQPAYGQQPSPYGQQPTGYAGPAGDPDKRPGTVTAASVITIIFSGLSLLLFGVMLIGLLVAKDQVLDEIQNAEGFEDAGLSANDALGAAVAVVGVFAVWSLIALILGFMVLRRSNAARITLVISSAVTALLSLLGIGSGVSAITLIAAIAVIVLLFVGGAGDWFSRRSSASVPGMTTY